MCHEATGKPYDRPLFSEDVPLIAGHYPNVPIEGVWNLYEALTDAFWPKPAVLIAFLELVDRALQNDIGYYTNPTIPFSAMDLETFDRVQTDAMADFHSVFEGFPLAERNKGLVDSALTKSFELKLAFFHDCGCSIVPAESDPFAEEWYAQINTLRSLAEAVGTPVVRVTDFLDPEWTSRQEEHGLDMGPSEKGSYVRMHRALRSLPARSFDLFELASPKFAQLFQPNNVAA
jgi:hypothetical protein